jgi:hypothetical protein
MGTTQRTIKEMAQDLSLHKDIEDYTQISRWFIRIDKDGDRREVFVEQTETEEDADGCIAYSVSFVYSDNDRFFQDLDVRQNARANGKESPVYEPIDPLRAAQLGEELTTNNTTCKRNTRIEPLS